MGEKKVLLGRPPSSLRSAGNEVKTLSQSVSRPPFHLSPPPPPPRRCLPLPFGLSFHPDVQKYAKRQSRGANERSSHGRTLAGNIKYPLPILTRILRVQERDPEIDSANCTRAAIAR